MEDPFNETPTEKAPEPTTRTPGDEAAARITAKLEADGYQGELPEEVERIWGNSPKDERTARTLIQAWGMQAFLGSALHLEAVEATSREQRMDPIRKAFVKAQEKKEKR